MSTAAKDELKTQCCKSHAHPWNDIQSWNTKSCLTLAGNFEKLGRKVEIRLSGPQRQQ
jgi:hypothetical protein